MILLSTIKVLNVLWFFGNFHYNSWYVTSKYSNMLDYVEEFINKKPRLKSGKSGDLLENLKVWNKDLQPYLDIVNPKCPFWETHKMVENLPLDNPDLNREFIKLLFKKNPNSEKMNYETIIDSFYQMYENCIKNLEEEEKQDKADILLKEVKRNALKIFRSLMNDLEKKPNLKISSFRMATLIKILRWDSICFVTNPWWDRATYIQFDKEYTSPWISRRINNYEGNLVTTEKDKHLLIARRHVDEWADLSKMKECLKKYRDFSTYFIKWSKPYVVSETWLNDTNFFKFYEEYLKKFWRDPQNQKTIQNLNLTKKYSICKIKFRPLNFYEDYLKQALKDPEKKKIIDYLNQMESGSVPDINYQSLYPEWKNYLNRRRKFVKDWESSLCKALQEYESLWFKLQEWKAVLDLTKID